MGLPWLSLTTFWLLFLLGVCAVEVGRRLPKTIRIGGLFEHEFRGQELVFKYAIEKVNARRDMLAFTKLVYDIQTAPADDSFTASKKVCRQLREGGVAAIFGPMSIMSASHVQSICDAMEIPHVETRWNFHDNADTYSINLYPYYKHLSQAYIELIKHWGWSSFTILYEDNEGLLRLQELLMSPSRHNFQITVRRLESLEGSFREILKEIRDRGETHIVLDCDYTRVHKILSEAMSVNMMNQYYHYLLTTLDVGLVDLEDFKYGGTNITAFRLVDPMRPQVEEVMADWIMDEYRTGSSPRENERGFRNTTFNIRVTTETALTYDAVHLFAKALDDLSHAKDIQTEALSCSKGKPWTHGNSLINYMKMADFDGLTGKVRFDPEGLRTDFELDILEHSIAGLEKIGMWSPRSSVGITKNYTQVKERIASDLSNQTLRVTTILESPYVMEKQGWQARNLTGNARFEGFCVDLLREIAFQLKFNFTIHLVRDGKYGAINSSGQWNGMVRELIDKDSPFIMMKNDPTGTAPHAFEGYCVDLLDALAEMVKFNYTIHLVKDEAYGAEVMHEGKKTWNGMVGELIREEADLAVASLTISWVREQVIDFTKPFMNLGISILFKKPEKQNPSLFSFLSPLSFEIWVYMLAAYLAVSFMLFVLARFTPYEWYNPHPCNPDGDIVENQFTLLNSLWFTIGSLMQQGSEVAPRALSTRIVSGIWWFFTLIIISSYTANLAAFLTVERMTSPIENADDLSRQTDIKYGTIKAGSTMTFFKQSKIPTYERMWNFMDSNPSVFAGKTEEGIEWVKKGGYAFLLESTMNEYTTQRECELMQVGGLLDSKGYGIGTPLGSKYRDLLSNAILKLQESQKLHMLYNKWWKEKGGGGQCSADDKGKKDANALAIAHVGGVFVVLLAGLVLSLFVAICEFIWKARKNADEDSQPLCTEMAEEFRFAMSCFGSSTKPAKKKPKMADMHEHYMDGNGMTMMPLTGPNQFGHRSKEPYS